MEAPSEACSDRAQDDGKSFSERAAELFDTIAEDDSVYVNPRGLLTVLTDIDLFVTEEQFTDAAGKF